MAPLIPVALKIAGAFAPRIIRWIAGDEAGDVAKEVVDAAKSVAGVDDADEAIREITADPNLLAQLRAQLEAIEVAKMEQQTAQLRELQRTHRAEIISNDKFVRRARPSIIYVTAGLLATTGLCVLLAIVGAIVAAMMGDGEMATALMAGAASLVGSLMPIITAAAAATGLYINARSRDKAVAEGQIPAPSIFGEIGRAVAARVAPAARRASGPPRAADLL